MKALDLSMTADQIKSLSDNELAEGVLLARRLKRENFYDLQRAEKQRAAIRRSISCIDRTPLEERPPVMLKFSSELHESGYQLLTEINKLRARGKMLEVIHSRWFDADTDRQYQAWQAKLDADLIDPDCTPVESKPEHTCHCVHTCCS
jgi:hypothetical protein